MIKVVPESAVLIPDSATLKYSGEIFSVYTWPQKLYSGETATFEMLMRRDTVTAFCLVDNKLIVLDDEQPCRGKKKTLPGGQVDSSDDSTLDSVKREVEEETGYSFKNWKLVKVRQPYTKIEWFIYVYVAWEQTAKKPADPGPGEKIDLSLVSLADFKDLINFKNNVLTENYDLVENVNSLDELTNLSEFKGKQINRTLAQV